MPIIQAITEQSWFELRLEEAEAAINGDLVPAASSGFPYGSGNMATMADIIRLLREMTQSQFDRPRALHLLSYYDMLEARMRSQLVQSISHLFFNEWPHQLPDKLRRVHFIDAQLIVVVFSQDRRPAQTTGLAPLRGVWDN